MVGQSIRTYEIDETSLDRHNNVRGALTRLGFGCVALSTLPTSGAAQRLLEGALGRRYHAF